jgi:probable rRNA maturation factor
VTLPPVAVSLGRTRSPVSAARIAAAASLVLRAERVRTALLSVTLVGRERMARLNLRHLGHHGPTDVIAFGFRDPVGAVIGDVYVCPGVAALNARRFRVPVREEVLRLVVHGTLHALGHDHPAGAARATSTMWTRQEELLRRVLRA